MLQKDLRDILRIITDAYCKASGDSRAKISKRLYGRSGFLDQLFSGEQSISIDRISALFDQFRDVWPEDTAWPPLPVITIAGPVRGKLSPRKRAKV